MATSSRKLPGLGITGGWANGEDGYDTDMNTNWLMLSVLTQGSVIDIVTTLPHAPSQGNIYLMDSMVTTYGNRVAVYDNGAWTYLVPQAGWTLFVVSKKADYQFDGTTWTQQTTLRSSKVRFLTTAVSSPLANETLGLFVADGAITFPVNFAGSVCKVGTAPAATYVLGVMLNATEVGSIQIGTDGTATFTASSAIIMAAGDVLSVVGSATPDSTLSSLALNLVGTES